MELYRLLISQISERYAKKATSSKEGAEALEAMLEESKPYSRNQDWDILIFTPLRYPLPVLPQYQARFRPPYFHRNAFYGAETKTTAAFEASFHFLRQRVHLGKVKDDAGLRTLFSAEATTKNLLDIRGHVNINQIMNRNDYSESHRLAQAEKLVDGFLYPSCRDPEQGLCAAIYEIKCFDKDVKREWNVHFEYNSQTKSVTWNRHEILDITVAWNQVQ